MDANEFRLRGREMVDYIADYMENLHERRVLPEVQPGYLRELLPNKAPHCGEKWTDIWKDVEKAIMIGVRLNVQYYFPYNLHVRLSLIAYILCITFENSAVSKAIKTASSLIRPPHSSPCPSSNARQRSHVLAPEPSCSFVTLPDVTARYISSSIYT